MSQPSERAVLKRMLDHYDQLGALRERIQGQASDLGEAIRLRQETRKKIDLIGKDLTSLTERSALGQLLARYKVNKYQLIVLLALLRRRLESDNPYLKGRQLLALLFDSSFDFLRGCSFLEPNAMLQSAGLVVPEVKDDDEEEDLLETSFKISDRVFRMVRNSFFANRALRLPTAKAKAQPYKSNVAYLIDLRRLSLLYRKRAARVFNVETWEDVGLGAAESATTLNQQLARFRDRIEQSLKLTRKAGEFPIVTMIKEFALGEEELVVLVTLMFQELLEGGAFLDAVDLLKLVSSSEEDLVRRRRFLGKRSVLVRHNLIALEEMVNDKELTAEVYLPNWVIERMLGKETTGKIDADARIEFHDYLKNLGSSEDFFNELEEP